MVSLPRILDIKALLAADVNRSAMAKPQRRNPKATGSSPETTSDEITADENHGDTDLDDQPDELQDTSEAKQEPGTWSVAQHDTIPPVDLWINPLETQVYLWAYLNAEGLPYSEPNAGIRDLIEKTIEEIKARNKRGKKPRPDIEESRIRTWKSAFENAGILFIDRDNHLRLTRLGHAINSAYKRLNEQIEIANDRIAKIAVDVLNKYTLRNPIDAGAYPEDTDLRPFHAIWKAMRSLNDKLHYQEMNRVIMKLIYEHDIDNAIAKIRTVRTQVADIYDEHNLHLLGSPAVQQDKQTKRRITPWFTRAGFGGLLISSSDDENGYRNLVDRYKYMIDNAIEKHVTTPPAALTSQAAYRNYITDVESITGPPPSPSDTTRIASIRDAVRKHGATKIICLSGIPGTGKTRSRRWSPKN